MPSRPSKQLAGEEIGVTQGAVAQQVRGLEAVLGITLFDRLPRGLALTESTTLQLQHRAVLAINVTPSFAAKSLVPGLGQFTDANPNVDVRADFQSDGIDIAVRQREPPFGPGQVAEPLFAMKVHAACSPPLIAGDRRPSREAWIWPDVARDRRSDRGPGHNPRSFLAGTDGP